MTLAEWLRAQLDEDEQAALSAKDVGDVKDGRWYDDEYADVDDDSAWRVAFSPDPRSRAHIARHDPARVLAEVAATRCIIDLHEGDHNCPVYDHTGDIDSYALVVGGNCTTMRLLALPYADRPGYQAEWRP